MSFLKYRCFPLVLYTYVIISKMVIINIEVPLNAINQFTIYFTSIPRVTKPKAIKG